MSFEQVECCGECKYPERGDRIFRNVEYYRCHSRNRCRRRGGHIIASLFRVRLPVVYGRPLYQSHMPPQKFW